MTVYNYFFSGLPVPGIIIGITVTCKKINCIFYFKIQLKTRTISITRRNLKEIQPGFME